MMMLHNRFAKYIVLVTLGFALFGASAATAEETAAPAKRKPVYTKDKKVQAVIDEVDKQCRKQNIYMVGPEKAARLAELVRQKKPKRVVECGTAVGYSGLWIARELKAAGGGKLITIEISPRRAKEAADNFKRAGLEDFVEVRVGDARKLAAAVKGPIDFVFIDCGASNYYPCLVGVQGNLADGAVLVADNAGISAGGMGDYFKAVRSRYDSHTEWFQIDLPWAKRDALEISIVKPKKK